MKGWARGRRGVPDVAAESGDGYGGRLFCWFGNKKVREFCLMASISP